MELTEHVKTKINKGPSLRRMNDIMAGISLLFSIILVVTIIRLAGEYKELSAAIQNYDELRESAEELMDASDYLTEQVRNFTVTGQRAYLDNYFQEAYADRRRERALDQLREKGSAEAAHELEQAMAGSVELMNTEFLAMHLTAFAYGYDLADLPIQVREAQIPETYAKLSREELQDDAIHLVLSEEYSGKKASIASSMEQCLNRLVEDMGQRQSAAEGRLQWLIDQLWVVGAAFIVLILARVFITANLVISPLLRGVLSIREGEEIPVRGADEFRFLASTYNQMFRETQKKTEDLTFEVEHDKLTGVYNRGGYDQLLANLDLRSAALLLVDVDKFKGINDTFGHKEGDEALRRVAQALAENFRSMDCVCRIGGDEFAVIMKNTGPEHREDIRRKINRINEELLHPKDGYAAVSISVGCAFGASKNSSGAIDKDADVALYRVKEAGRCGCAFFDEE